MKVLGIRWLGSPTDRYAETVAFAKDVLGLELRFEAEDFAVFETANGDTFAESAGFDTTSGGDESTTADAETRLSDAAAESRRSVETGAGALVR